MTMSGGSSGQWVRTRTPEGARAFMKEKEIESRLRYERELRSQERMRAAWRWLRSLWSRIRRQ